MVSKDSGLRKTINAATNFEINPTVVSKGKEIVFFNEFVSNIGELDADVLSMIEGSCEIEVADVKTDEFRTGPREDAVDLKFEGFKGACVGADVAGVDDAIASTSDASVILLLFVWFVFTY